MKINFHQKKKTLLGDILTNILRNNEPRRDDKFKKEWLVRKLEEMVSGNKHWLHETIWCNVDKEEVRQEVAPYRK